MKRTGFSACALAAAAVFFALGAARGAEALKPPAVYLAAPARVAAGAELVIEGLIQNPNGEPITAEYKLETPGLTLADRAEAANIWLGAKALVPVRWKARAGAAGTAKAGLVLDGRIAAEATVVVQEPKPAAATALAGELDPAKPVAVELEPGHTYTVELEVTAGAAGELAATLDRLQKATGLGVNALVARELAPRALDAARKAPDFALLNLLQNPSGQWGPTLDSPPDVRTTSWVVFWLGRLAKAGGQVDGKALDAAVAALRKSMAQVNGDMQARVLSALASSGTATRDELASFAKAAGTAELSPAARLLAAYAGAEMPLPPREEWAKLNALETAVLVCCLTSRDEAFDTFRPLARLVELRGAEPRYDTHEAVLCALALRALADRAPKTPPRGTVTVSLNGTRLAQLDVGGTGAAAEAMLTAAVREGDRKGSLQIKATGAEGLCYRLVVRPAAPDALSSPAAK